MSSDGTNRLGLENRFWGELTTYIENVAALPDSLGGIGQQTIKAVDDLRRATDRFGSATQMRRERAVTSDLLASDGIPAASYTGIVWLVMRLHTSAVTIQSNLMSLVQTEPTQVDPVGRILTEISQAAQCVGAPVGPVLHELNRISKIVEAANDKFAAGISSEAAKLGTFQEAVGRDGFNVRDLEQRAAKLGMLTAKSKRQDIEAQLATARISLAENSNAASVLQGSLATLEDVAFQSQWLASGLEDLDGFLRTLRETLMTFGKALAQLAVDTTLEQRNDQAWVQNTLDPEKTALQWHDIARASQDFLDKHYVI
ncbi:MAG: hypothetical protein KC448_13635 [Yoonia sp.]|nr:hypothetical protein [Yoonia sp.]